MAARSRWNMSSRKVPADVKIESSPPSCVSITPRSSWLESRLLPWKRISFTSTLAFSSTMVADRDLVVGQRLELVGDLGQVVALLDVLLLDLLDVLLHRHQVEDGEGLHLDGVLEVVLGQLVVADDGGLADGGALGDLEDQHGAAGAALDLDHHVGEEAELHEGPDVGLDAAGVVERPPSW